MEWKQFTKDGEEHWRLMNEKRNIATVWVSKNFGNRIQAWAATPGGRTEIKSRFLSLVEAKGWAESIVEMEVAT